MMTTTGTASLSNLERMKQELAEKKNRIEKEQRELEQQTTDTMVMIALEHARLEKEKAKELLGVAQSTMICTYTSVKNRIQKEYDAMVSRAEYLRASSEAEKDDERAFRVKVYEREMRAEIVKAEKEANEDIEQFKEEYDEMLAKLESEHLTKVLDRIKKKEHRNSSCVAYYQDSLRRIKTNKAAVHEKLMQEKLATEMQLSARKNDIDAAMDRVLRYSVYIEEADEMRENSERINSAAMVKLPVFDRAVVVPNKAEPTGEYSNKVKALVGGKHTKQLVLVNGVYERRPLAKGIFNFDRLICDESCDKDFGIDFDTSGSDSSSVLDEVEGVLSGSDSSAVLDEVDLYTDEKLELRTVIEEIEEEDEAAGTYSLDRHEKLSRPIKGAMQAKYGSVAAELEKIIAETQKNEKEGETEERSPSMFNYLFRRE